MLHCRDKEQPGSQDTAPNLSCSLERAVGLPPETWSFLAAGPRGSQARPARTREVSKRQEKGGSEAL